MADSRTPTLVDYSNALRHGWRILAVCAVLGGLGGASYGAFLVAQQFVVRVGVFTNQDFEHIAAVSAPGVIPEFLPVEERSLLESELPLTHPDYWGDDLIRLSSEESTGALYVSVTETDPNLGIAIAMDILRPIVVRQKEQFSIQQSLVRTSLESTITALEERTSATSTVVDRSTLFSVQASWLSDYSLLSVARQQLTALESVEDMLTGGVTEPTVIGEPTPIERTSTTSYAILGVLFGLALGIPTMVVRRFFDDRLLSVNDVWQSGIEMRMLGTFHRQDGWVQNDDGLSTATALIRDLPSGQPMSLQIIEVTTSGHLGSISEDLVRALDTIGRPTGSSPLVIRDLEGIAALRSNLSGRDSGFLVATGPALGDSGLGVVVGSATDRTVLVISLRHDRRSAIAEVAALLDASGVVIEGLILIVG